MSVENKVTIITGAGSGIGAATAKHFGNQGAKVVVADVNIKSAVIIANEINEKGGMATSLKCDVTVYEEVDSLIMKTVEQFGRLDVMVNNAGIGSKNMVKTAEHSKEDWHNVIDVNQNGVFYCMKLALTQMMKQGEGKQGKGNIVNVASLAGLKASGNNLAYAASKFAVVGMTKSAALEYASRSIRINCVCPGYTHSALLNTVFDSHESMHDKLLKFIPMGRYGKPEEIAEAILWLASDNTSFITGQAITLDGGLSL